MVFSIKKESKKMKKCNITGICNAFREQKKAKEGVLLAKDSDVINASSNSSTIITNNSMAPTFLFLQPTSTV